MENGGINLESEFTGLSVYDTSNPNNDGLFQVMKAVEAAEVTIKQQVNENNRLRAELQRKTHELEKYMAQTTHHHVITVPADPKSNPSEDSTVSAIFDWTSGVVMTLSCWSIISLLALTYSDGDKRVPTFIFKGQISFLRVFAVLLFIGFCTSWVAVVTGFSAPKLLISYKRSKLLIKWCSVVALSAMYAAAAMLMFLFVWDMVEQYHAGIGVNLAFGI